MSQGVPLLVVAGVLYLPLHFMIIFIIIVIITITFIVSIISIIFIIRILSRAVFCSYEVS